MRHVFPALLVAIPGLASCDSSSPGGSSIGPGQINQALADHLCGLLAECTLGGDASIFATLVAASDRTACRAFFQRVVARESTDFQARVQAGELTYDAKKLEQCLASRKGSCQLNELSPCSEAFDGKVPLDGACASDLDCAGEATCAFVDSAAPQSCASGRCSPLAARGERCDYDGSCSQGAGPTACTWSASTCVPLTQEASVAEGGRCDESHDANGVTRRTCASGLVCVGQGSGDVAFCRRPLEEGANCSETFTPCKNPTVCLSGGGDSQTCQRPNVVRTVGADCNLDSSAGPVVICSVIDQLGCFEGKCRKWGNGTAGAYCDLTFETDFSCNRGFYCTGTATCAAQKAAGAECEDSSECLEGFCDQPGTTGTCVAYMCT